MKNYKCPSCGIKIDPKTAHHPTHSISDYYEEEDYDWVCLECFIKWAKSTGIDVSIFNKKEMEMTTR